VAAGLQTRHSTDGVSPALSRMAAGITKRPALSMVVRMSGYQGTGGAI
jgi:hypothetical protein